MRILRSQYLRFQKFGSPRLEDYAGGQFAVDLTTPKTDKVPNVCPSAESAKAQLRSATKLYENECANGEQEIFAPPPTPPPSESARVADQSPYTTNATVSPQTNDSLLNTDDQLAPSSFSDIDPFIKVSYPQAGPPRPFAGTTSDGLPLSLVQRNIVLNLRNLDPNTPSFRVLIKFSDEAPTNTYLDFYRGNEGHLWRRETRLGQTDKRRRYYFCCSLCAKRLCSFNTLRYHLNAHLGYYPHECETCEKRYVSRRSLARHLKVLH